MIEPDVFPNTDENRRRLESASGKQVVRPVKVDAQKDSKKKIGRPKKAKAEEVESDTVAPDVALLIEACELPFTLQRILVDDRDKITQTVYPPSSIFSPRTPEETYKKGITMLHQLPSSMSIQTILARFLDKKKKDDLEEFVRERGAKSDANALDENVQTQQQPNNDADGDGNEKTDADKDTPDPNETVMARDIQTTHKSTTHKIMTKDMLKLRKKKRKQFALSILELVDAALPKALLYATEQMQYNKFISGKGSSNDNSTRLKRPSEIYGGEHMLRLFVKLPDLIASTTIPTDSEEIAELAGFLSELIVFLQKNCGQCFKDRYYAVFNGGGCE